MNDGRRHRKAKQARRDARRIKKRTLPATHADEEKSEFPSLHPVTFLMWMSAQIQATKPDPYPFLKRSRREAMDFEDLLARFVDDPRPEAGVVLSLAAELHEEEEMRLRYRAALDGHEARIPKWIAGLRSTDVYRAVCCAHVLGERHEIVIGARLADGQEMTCAVHFSYNFGVEISDACFVGRPIESVLEEFAEQADPDFTVTDMSLADVRAWVAKGLTQPIVARETESWPDGRPLLRWLIRRLPDGGESYQSPAWEWEAANRLCEDFFASERGAPFDRRHHKDILQELFETGTEDPLRWSVNRVHKVLDSPMYSVQEVPLCVVLEIPELLKAFIPFAHERSGIREGLTAQALAVLDGIGCRVQGELRDTA